MTRELTKLLPFFSPDGNEAAPVEEQTKPPAPAADEHAEVTDNQEQQTFDPSKIDTSDVDVMSSLNDEQIAKLEEYEKNKASAAPGSSPDKDTDESDTSEESQPGAAEKGGESAGKYAGKYTTTDDLAAGVNEIAKKVGYPTEAVQVVLDAAKQVGNFKSVEALYKTLEAQLGKTTPKVPEKPEDKPSDTFNADDPKVVTAVDKLTQQQMKGSDIVSRMQAKGITVPTSMEEFDALAESYPYFAAEFQRQYEMFYSKNLKEAQGYFEAERGVETNNTSVIDADLKAVRDMANAEGFKVSDAELEAVRVEALANPYNYDVKYGHKFLRPNAVRDQFLISRLPLKMKEVAVAKEASGRAQAVADLEKAQKREVGSIGTSRINTRTRSVAKMPDLSDPAVLESLPDEALNDPDRYFKNFSK